MEEEILLWPLNSFGVKVNLSEASVSTVKVFNCVKFLKKRLGHDFWNHFAQGIWCSEKIYHLEGPFYTEVIYPFKRFSVSGKITLLGDKFQYWKDISLEY